MSKYSCIAVIHAAGTDSSGYAQRPNMAEAKQWLREEIAERRCDPELDSMSILTLTYGVVRDMEFVTAESLSDPDNE